MLGNTGVNVIGHVTGDLGLGVSTRQLIEMLLSRGISVAALDLDAVGGRGGRDLEYAHLAVRRPEELPHGINLAVLPPHAAPDFFWDPPKLVNQQANFQDGYKYWLRPDRVNVAVVFWELPVLSALPVQALELFDIVIGPSPFVRGTLETHLSDTVTIGASHPYYLPAYVENDRSRFSLPESEVLFVTSFEPTSDLQRKNPFACLDAFRLAFGDDSSARLIVNVHNSGQSDPRATRGLERLRSQCAGHKRISVLEQALSHVDVLTLYSACDVFVSLHRAEGLGFAPMEAMLLGKPVIATGWSGNMAYMDHSNSAPVNYRLVPVQSRVPSYEEAARKHGARWAEPDVEHAAAWMQTLAGNAQLRSTMGDSARAAINRYQSEARQGRFIDEIQSIIGSSKSRIAARRAGHLRDVMELGRNLDDSRAKLLPIGERLRYEAYATRRDVSRRVRHVTDRYIGWRFK